MKLGTWWNPGTAFRAAFRAVDAPPRFCQPLPRAAIME